MKLIIIIEQNNKKIETQFKASIGQFGPNDFKWILFQFIVTASIIKKNKIIKKIV